MAKRRNKKKTGQKTESKSVISPVVIAGVTVAAILMVAGLIVLGNQSRAGEPVDVGEFPTMGDPNAPVTLVEYSDYG